MNKLKTMLLSFTLLFVIGGAFAFKARFANTFYCTAPTNGQPSAICTSLPGVRKFCPNLIISTTVDKGHGTAGIWCTTTPQDFDGDGLAIECVDVNGTDVVRCLTTGTLYIN